MQALQQHSLSRAALLTSGAPIFLLDAFTTIIILYTSGYPPHLPYPPPAGSAVRRAAAQLRGSRRQIPQLLMLREGVDDVAPFMGRLLEVTSVHLPCRSKSARHLSMSLTAALSQPSCMLLTLPHAFCLTDVNVSAVASKSIASLLQCILHYLYNAQAHLMT